MPSSHNLHQLVEGEQLTPEEEKKLVDSLAKNDPGTLAFLSHVVLKQRRQLRSELLKARADRKQLETLARQLETDPWFPGTVLQTGDNGRLDVFCDGRRQIVGTAADVEAGKLRPGDEVFLNGQGVIVAHNEGSARTGLVGVVSEVGAAGLLVRGAGDEELHALCVEDLAQELRVGDRVLYQREVPFVFQRLPEREASEWILETPKPICFEDIGGLDGIIDDILQDLQLHLLHAERVAAYRLQIPRGMLLVGPPGVGKSLLAGAIARYLAEARPDTRFLNVPPGAVRGSFYGETERRIREIFAVARAAPGMVVVFMDELDHFGARGAGIGQDIDGRILGALLAEIDGLQSTDNVLCLGASNRLDLCDTALIRQSRFGDRVYEVPRPGRDATRQILSKYLTPELPYADAGDAAEACATLIDAATSFLHAPEGGAGILATATLQNSERREIGPPAVLSGALLASAVDRAKHVAARRHLQGGEGITLEDLLDALDEALTAEARKASAPHVARQMLSFDGSDEIVLVELPPQRSARRHRYLRAA
jgi:proteasome-associated ATPase